jgi:hypothetical protein
MKNTTRVRVEGYFNKYPDRLFTKKQLEDHFTDLKPHTIQYHLDNLRTAKFILAPKQGTYGKNPEHKSLEQIQAEVEAHSKANPRVISDGRNFDSGKEAIISSIDPMIARMFSQSILERMKKLDQFTDQEVSFVEKILYAHFGTKFGENGKQNGALTAVS